MAGLPGSTTFARASFLIKGTWKPKRIRRTSLRFRAGDPSCHYAVTFRMRTVLGPAVTPADRVLADLPVKAPAYLLDSGTRPPGAWRVTRAPGTNPVRIRGEHARIAHADVGLVPAGQAAWTTIVARAHTLPHGECHAGTWRASVGPGIGDAFATARVSGYARRAA
ncbi:MAG TPA: hypothetical protein VFT50_19100 [Baekduia sp.]|nr:hypothetical protein [Baekduia sp.]